MKVELVAQGQYHTFKQAFAVQHDIRQHKVSVLHAEDDAVIPESIDIPMNLRLAMMPELAVDSIMITIEKKGQTEIQLTMPIDSEPI